MNLRGEGTGCDGVRLLKLLYRGLDKCVYCALDGDAIYGGAM